MSKIIGVTVGTPTSPKKIEEELKPVKTVNGVAPDENGNVEVGGSGGGVLCVTATITGSETTDGLETLTGTADKTFAEIYEACEAGQSVFLRVEQNDSECDMIPLVFYNSRKVFFSYYLHPGDIVVTAGITSGDSFVMQVSKMTSRINSLIEEKLGQMPKLTLENGVLNIE